MSQGAKLTEAVRLSLKSGDYVVFRADSDMTERQRAEFCNTFHSHTGHPCCIIGTNVEVSVIECLPGSGLAGLPSSDPILAIPISMPSLKVAWIHVPEKLTAADFDAIVSQLQNLRKGFTGESK